MAAALACLDVLEREDTVGHIGRIGVMLRDGIEAQALKHGLEIVYSGPPAMPFLTFKNDMKFARSRSVAAACAEGGVYLAPYHN